MRRYVVDDQAIEVEIRVLGRYFWLAGGFVVRVGDDVFLPSEKMEIGSTTTNFQIPSGDGMKNGVVRSIKLPLFVPKVPYEVVIDGTTIATDSQPIGGIGLASIILFVLGATMAVLMVLIIVIAISVVRAIQST